LRWRVHRICLNGSPHGFGRTHSRTGRNGLAGLAHDRSQFTPGRGHADARAPTFSYMSSSQRWHAAQGLQRGLRFARLHRAWQMADTPGLWYCGAQSQPAWTRSRPVHRCIRKFRPGWPWTIGTCRELGAIILMRQRQPAAARSRYHLLPITPSLSALSPLYLFLPLLSFLSHLLYPSSSCSSGLLR